MNAKRSRRLAKKLQQRADKWQVRAERDGSKVDAMVTAGLRIMVEMSIAMAELDEEDEVKRE